MKKDDDDMKNVRLADENILEKLTTDEEMSGFLNWILKGLQRYLREGDFTKSKGSKQIEEMWMRRSNSFYPFLLDYLEEDYDGKISKSELRKAYSIYCREHKVKLISDKGLKNILIGIGMGDERNRSDGQQITYWSGIRFKSGMGGTDGMGFSTYIQKKDLVLDAKQHTKNTTLTELEEKDVQETELGKGGMGNITQKTPIIEEKRVETDQKTPKKHQKPTQTNKENIIFAMNQLYSDKELRSKDLIYKELKDQVPEETIEKIMKQLSNIGFWAEIKKGMVMLIK